MFPTYRIYVYYRIPVRLQHHQKPRPNPNLTTPDKGLSALKHNIIMPDQSVRFCQGLSVFSRFSDMADAFIASQLTRHPPAFYSACFAVALLVYFVYANIQGAKLQPHPLFPGYHLIRFAEPPFQAYLFPAVVKEGYCLLVGSFLLYRDSKLIFCLLRFPRHRSRGIRPQSLSGSILPSSHQSSIAQAEDPR